MSPARDNMQQKQPTINHFFKEAKTSEPNPTADRLALAAQQKDQGDWKN